MPCTTAHRWGKSVGAETQAALHAPSSVPHGGGPLYPKELPAPYSHTTPELLLNEWTLDFRWSMRETLKDWEQEGKEAKIEGKRRRRQQRMRRLDDSVDMSLSKLWEIVKDKEARRAAVHWVAKRWAWLNYWTATNERGSIYLAKIEVEEWVVCSGNLVNLGGEIIPWWGNRRKWREIGSRGKLKVKLLSLTMLFLLVPSFSPCMPLEMSVSQGFPVLWVCHPPARLTFFLLSLEPWK